MTFFNVEAAKLWIYSFTHAMGLIGVSYVGRSPRYTSLFDMLGAAARKDTLLPIEPYNSSRACFIWCLVSRLPASTGESVLHLLQLLQSSCVARFDLIFCVRGMVSCSVVVHCARLCCFVLCCVCFTVIYYLKLCCTVQSRSVFCSLHCNVLCCIVWYCAMLCCSVLWCVRRVL